MPTARFAMSLISSKEGWSDTPIKLSTTSYPGARKTQSLYVRSQRFSRHLSMRGVVQLHV